MVNSNGNLKIILTLIGIITTLVTTAMAYTWGAVTENRKNIVESKDCINDKLDKILSESYAFRSDVKERLARIESKIGK